MISVRGGTVYLRDQGSKNGCFVNGRKIDIESCLNDQDVVRLAKCVGVVCESSPDSADHSVRVWRIAESRGTPREISEAPFAQALAARIENQEDTYLVGGWRLASALRLAQRVAQSDSPVVLVGKTATGKEGIARAIHAWSPRHEKPFVSENCATFVKNLEECQLFGYVKGAFEGATHDQEGLFQQAHEGTLFLDEVVELSPEVQPKLLRALAGGEVRRLGARNVEHVHVRVIAATQRPLQTAADAHRFRPDLQRRLQTLEVHLPALSERREDIPYLVDWLLQRTAQRLNLERPPELQPGVVERLCLDAWPLNVGGLESAVEQLINAASELSTSVVDVDVLYQRRGQQRLITALTYLPGLDGPDHVDPPPPPEATKDELIRKALQLIHKGVKVAAAVRQVGLVDWYRRHDPTVKNPDEAARRLVERRK